MRMLRNIVVISVCLAEAACRSSLDKQIRTASAPGDVVTTSISSLEADTAVRRAAAGATVEVHQDARVPAGDFKLAVVEFSDEGIAWSADQRKRVFDTIKTESEPNGSIIVVFVHGWRHNATVCDDNVACFRRVLQSFAVREQDLSEREGRKRRNVTGVYFGWRGLSSCSEPLTTTSIWRRKSIGENIGARAGREALRQIMRLFADIKEEDRKHPNRNSRLIIAGHSLGAGVVYSAVGPLLLQRLHDGIAATAPGRSIARIEDLDVATPVHLPDLVLLLNPAFEAEMYKPIQRTLSYMEVNNIHFAADQPPIMVTISSRHDSATKGIFFLGQLLDALVTPVMWAHGPAYVVRNLVTPPHFSPYITDRAIPLQKLPNRVGSDNGDSCFDKNFDPGRQRACGCAELTPERLELMRHQTASSFTLSRSREKYGPVRLEHLRGDPKNPFLVVTAGDLIRDHDDIYNATLLAFITDLISTVDFQKREEGR